jgi:sigma-E factor negative regulatory protein RseA
MKSEMREHLSCLMDGEIKRETGRFLIRRLGSDEELCATWARYHLARDCLRDQEGGFASTDLTRRVRSAIEHEAPPARRTRGMAGWLKPVAGAAIAASVALAAIVVVNPPGQPAAEAPATADGTTAAESFTSPQGLSSLPASSQASLSGGDSGDNAMKPYLLRHYQAAGSAVGRGFVTFVPIVVTRSDESTGPVEEEAGAQAGTQEDAQNQ